MIHIFISLILGLGVFFLLFSFGFTITGIILGNFVAFGVFILLSKIITKKITTIVEASSAELTKGQFDKAIAILEGGLKYKYRHPFLAAQLNSQIGVTYYYKKDVQKAEEYLKKGIASHFIGQCILGVIYMKKKNLEQMKKTFILATRASGKESIVWSIYAYCLNSLGLKDEAIQILNKGHKRLPGDEIIKANLLALQNNEKMKMRGYKELWTIFMLEKTIVRQQASPFQRGGGGVRRIYRR